jgi:hypothetical protein
MHLALHLSVAILKKAAIVFGVILALSTFLFLLNDYRLRSQYGSPMSGTGTVRFLDFEGGFWGIISEDGKNYEISSDSFFPDEFQVSGLRVEFVGYRHGSGNPSHHAHILFPETLRSKTT